MIFIWWVVAAILAATAGGATPAGQQPLGTAPAAVRAGAYCSPEGARGVTNAGTAMRCTRLAGEARARWRRG